MTVAAPRQLGRCLLWLATVGAIAAPLGAEAAVLTKSRPGALAERVDPLALTQEMRDFVDANVSRRISRPARLLALREAIFDPVHGLGVTYGSSATHTAAETLDRRTGNCLSFTFLYVALARYLDLKAYFVEVDEVTGWSQRGDVGFSHWHMYAEVEVENGVAQIDFLPWSDRRYQSERRIGEVRARAHYFSNIGAEAVAHGDLELAVGHLETALALDPRFRPAQVNLAVALRRTGRYEEAESALLEVLEVEPKNTVAAANLASLYIEQGREADAAHWLERRRRFLDANPFHHFRLGMAALQDGLPEAARSHFKRAIDLQPREAAFHEQMATAQLRLGESRRARASLRRALHLTDEPARRALLERRLREARETPDPA